MKQVIFPLFAVLAAAGAQAQTTSAQGAAGDIAIARAGSQASSKGPAANFTGAVRVDPLFQPKEPSRTSAAWVTFEPGARSAWHTHPAGQTLVVTSGVGRVQRWGGKVEEIRAGDVIWTPPGVKHWHGATDGSAMTHIAIQDSVDGKPVDWLEHVTDEQYLQNS